MLLFTCRDSAVEAYGKPVFAPTRAAAIRSFGDEVNSPSFSHPECFDLYCIGSFDEETGVLISNVVPEFVIKAIDLVKDSNPYPIGGV